MSGPITPKEVVDSKITAIPEAVFEIFNDAIVKNFKDGTAIFKQHDIVLDITEALNITIIQVFERGYLEVEEVYRNAGWNVRYSKPGPNENYHAFFQFTK